MFGTASATAFAANILSAMIIFNNPDYNPLGWHTAMFMWVFAFIPLVFNLYFRHLLNTLEMIGAILHVVFFIVTIITLAAMANRSTVDYVFNTLTTGVSGWTNPGVSFGIGLLTAVFPLAGNFVITRNFVYYANH